MEIIDSTSNNLYDELDILKHTTEKSRKKMDFISTEQSILFRLINLSALSQSICFFGIVTNAMNMMVFYKQGFSTTTNISFFALAISDMTCLIITEWYGICLNPYLENADIPFIAKEVQHLAGGWLHVGFTRITGWITVFITAERCLGIALPLKVKQIITLRRAKICMVIIFVVNLATLLPEYCITYWDLKFVPSKNKTLVGLVFRSFKNDVYGLVHNMTSVSGILSFLAVICLTSFLVTKLTQKSHWRHKVTSGADPSEAISTRDKKTMKMIAMIASVLIVCYTPGTIVSFVTDFEPEFMLTAAYENSFFSFWALAFMFDTINSSVNVFLYYNMSTKYRQTFNGLFCKCRVLEK